MSKYIIIEIEPDTIRIIESDSDQTTFAKPLSLCSFRHFIKILMKIVGDDFNDWFGKILIID
jgi:hypothetical protein